MLFRSKALALAGALIFLTGSSLAREPLGKKAVVEDKVVAGSPSDFMEVRHLVLKGTNQEIGAALATLARERFATKPLPSPEPLRTRVQRRFIEKNYPILFERMRGAAATWGHRLSDDSVNLTALPYPTDWPPGCSVVYFPPGMTANKTGIISRNYDFTTGTLRGTRPQKGELAATARPYIIEMYPDRGYPSLAICSYDLLSGVLDGMNARGLTVALLADDELNSKFRMEPAGFNAVGLGALQMLRFLLDTCADVDEAKEALLLTKQYYEIIPVHYLVADSHGKSFVWEYSQAHNKEYIVESPGLPLITTNFSLHRYLQHKQPPSAKAVKNVCPRYCLLTEKIKAHPDKLTLEAIKGIHKHVDATRSGLPSFGRALGRTLWHALYVPEERKMQVSFYLRDEPEGGQTGKARIVRSDYLEYSLRGAEPFIRKQ
jgi:hypothetical protein